MDRSVVRVIRKFTALFEKKQRCWIGWVEGLPGASTQGATLDETRDNLKEAVRLVLEANHRLAADHPRDGSRELVKEELLLNV